MTRVARLGAWAALRVPILEKSLRAMCRRPVIARLSKAGAFAVSYPCVARTPEARHVDANGFRLVVNLAEHRGAAAYFFGTPRPTWLLDCLLRPGATCVDAGANVGLYTCAMACRAGPKGRVLAVEPHPTAAALLRKSVEANGFGNRVLVEEVALGSGTVSKAKLFLHDESELTSAVVESDRYLRVAATSLDRLARKHGFERVTLAKIDVERAEEDVLIGARQLLSDGAIDFIFIELLAQRQAHRLLRSHSYVGFLVLDDPRRLVDAEGVPADQFGDYLFVAHTRLHDVARISASVDLARGQST